MHTTFHKSMPQKPFLSFEDSLEELCTLHINSHQWCSIHAQNLRRVLGSIVELARMLSLNHRNHIADGRPPARKLGKEIKNRSSPQNVQTGEGAGLNSQVTTHWFEHLESNILNSVVIPCIVPIIPAVLLHSCRNIEVVLRNVNPGQGSDLHAVQSGASTISGQAWADIQCMLTFCEMYVIFLVKQTSIRKQDTLITDGTLTTPSEQSTYNIEYLVDAFERHNLRGISSVAQHHHILHKSGHGEGYVPSSMTLYSCSTFPHHTLEQIRNAMSQIVRTCQLIIRQQSFDDGEIMIAENVMKRCTEIFSLLPTQPEISK